MAQKQRAVANGIPVMKKILSAFILLFTVACLSVSTEAQGNPTSANSAPPSVLNTMQEDYLKRMRTMMDELNRAKTSEQRKEISKQMRQTSEVYRAANPPKELTPTQIGTRRQQVAEMLKRDPFQWEIYQLHQAKAMAAKPELERYDARIKTLASEHIAKEARKLTPEQRASVRVRQVKSVQMRLELKPLLAQLHAAKTVDERGALHAQILVVLERYQ